MKITLLALAFLSCMNLTAQKDSLPSAVYSFSKAKVQKSGNLERRTILNGSTLDLANLEIHTSTLLPGDINHPPKPSPEAEELIIIKEGSVQATVEDTTKVLGPGGLILLIGGDKQSIKNISDKPAAYYVLVYKSKDGLNTARGKAGGGSFMKDWKDYVTLETDKGQSRPIFDRPSSMFKRFDVHATALNPGIASHPPHTHRAEEIILMIKGTGEMQLGNTFHQATAGDVILVNSKLPHAIKNTGNVQNGYFAIQWHSNAE
jgi:(S)-ureidoglycine aminohydrolase